MYNTISQLQAKHTETVFSDRILSVSFELDNMMFNIIILGFEYRIHNFLGIKSFSFQMKTFSLNCILLRTVFHCNLFTFKFSTVHILSIITALGLC